MGKDKYPFDMNGNGKSDPEDHMLYDLFYEDNDNDHKQVRWSRRDTEILAEIIIGIILTVLLILFIIVWRGYPFF